MKNLDKKDLFNYLKIFTFVLTILIFGFTLRDQDIAININKFNILYFYIIYLFSIILITTRTAFILNFLKYFNFFTLYKKIWIINLSELFYSIIHPVAGYANKVIYLKKKMEFSNYKKPILLMVCEKSFVIIISMLYLLPTLILYFFQLSSNYYFLILFSLFFFFFHLQ